MNIIRRRYDVILKLTIMLALIGCFFIAGGKDVKAAGSITKIAMDAEMSKFTVDVTAGSSESDYVKSVIITVGTGTDAFDFEIPVPGASQTLAGNDVELTAVMPSSVISKAAQLDTKVISAKYKLSDNTTTGDITTQTAIKIYSVTPSNHLPEIDGFTIESKNNGSAVNPADTTAYCFAGGVVDVTATGIGTSYYVNDWTVSPTGTGEVQADKKIVKITVTNADVTCQPQPANKVDSITLDKTSIIANGNNQLINVTPKKGGATDTVNKVKWEVKSSTNPSITITYEGVANANKLYIKAPETVGNGSITLTATTDDGFTHDYTFTVSARVSYVKITADKTTLYAGQSAILTVIPVDDSGDPTGATISTTLWSKGTSAGTGESLSPTTESTSATATYTAPTTITAATTQTITVKVKDLFDTVDIGSSTKTATITINLKPKVDISSIKINPNPVEVTVGYDVDVSTTVLPAEALLSDTINFKITSGDSYFEISSQTPTTGKAVIKGVKATTTGKLRAESVSNTTKYGEATVKVYASPADSSAFKYTESSRILQGKSLPSKVLVGNASYDIDNVTGFKLYVMKGSETLGTITCNSTTRELSASDLENIIKNNTGKFSGETDTIKLRAVAIGTYGGSSEIREAKDNSGNLLAWEKDVTVYHMVAKTSDGIDYATVDTSYALEGQSVTFTATVASDRTFQKWVQGTSTTGNSTYTTAESKIPAKTSGNTYTAVAGVRSSSSGSTDDGTGGLDEVPKTSESNMPFIFIIFSVFAVIGTGYALYMTLRPARTSGTDDTDDYDNYDE